jgi:hypothetical protein
MDDFNVSVELWLGEGRSILVLDDIGTNIGSRGDSGFSTRAKRSRSKKGDLIDYWIKWIPDFRSLEHQKLFLNIMEWSAHWAHRTVDDPGFNSSLGTVRVTFVHGDTRVEWLATGNYPVFKPSMNNGEMKLELRCNHWEEQRF